MSDTPRPCLTPEEFATRLATNVAKRGVMLDRESSQQVQFAAMEIYAEHQTLLAEVADMGMEIERRTEKHFGHPIPQELLGDMQEIHATAQMISRLCRWAWRVRRRDYSGVTGDGSAKSLDQQVPSGK